MTKMLAFQNLNSHTIKRILSCYQDAPPPIFVTIIFLFHPIGVKGLLKNVLSLISNLYINPSTIIDLF